jgi:2'-5' RNA ligase
MRPNWFVALPVTTGPWFESLLSDLPHGCRAFHPSDVHMTVAFLGGCGEQLAERGWQSIAEQLSEPLELELGGLRALGNPRRPSALSLTVAKGHQRAAELIGAWRAPICAAAEARVDERPPLPHITVARVARKASGPERRAAIAWVESKEAIDANVVVDRVALYTWSMDRPVRQFRVVRQRRLDQPAPRIDA